MSQYVEEISDGSFAQVISAADPEIKYKNLKEATEQSGGLMLSSWQLIFQQSKVNNGPYGGDLLPAQNWDWPQETWFQKRLRYLRVVNRYRKGFTEKRFQ
jgi:hypothetical protein